MDIDYVTNQGVINVYHDEEKQRLAKLQEDTANEEESRLEKARLAAASMWGGNKDYLVDTTLHEDELVAIAKREASEKNRGRLEDAQSQEEREQEERIKKMADMWGGNKDYLVDTTLHEDELVAIAKREASEKNRGHLENVRSQEEREREERMKKMADMWGGGKKTTTSLASAALVAFTLFIGILPR